MSNKKNHSKKETLNNVFEHSQAKLDFYKNYLWRYLNILLNDKFTNKINIYDVFCGIGIYTDGGKGSPIVAIEAIKTAISKYPNKTVSLTINDIDKEKVIIATNYINENHKDTCSFNTYNKDAKEMFEVVIANIKKSKKNEKNLVFIDPYGYKEIFRQNIIDIMKAGKSEIILFLPIANMYRFSTIALTDEENNSYKHLRRFIEDFFEDKNHPLYQETYNGQLDYIGFIKEAFSIDDKYFSASYSIQRDTKNYYALFFITSHIYGLEKILETKWKLDDVCGEGFEKQKEATLFDEISQNEKISNCLAKLEDCIKSFLADDYRSNNEIYEYILKCGFLPKYANKILENMRNTLMFDRDLNLKKKSFLLGYKYYKNNDIKYKVKIKQ